MNFNELDSVDIRAARQLAHRLIDVMQHYPKGEQAMSLALLMAALGDLDVDLNKLLASGANGLKHAKTVHKAETAALLMYLDHCVL
jgi:hypothetical protein